MSLEKYGAMKNRVNERILEIMADLVEIRSCAQHLIDSDESVVDLDHSVQKLAYSCDALRNTIITYVRSLAGEESEEMDVDVRPGENGVEF